MFNSLKFKIVASVCVCILAWAFQANAGMNKPDSLGKSVALPSGCQAEYVVTGNTDSSVSGANTTGVRFSSVKMEYLVELFPSERGFMKLPLSWIGAPDNTLETSIMPWGKGWSYPWPWGRQYAEDYGGGEKAYFQMIGPNVALEKFEFDSSTSSWSPNRDGLANDTTDVSLTMTGAGKDTAVVYKHDTHGGLQTVEFKYGGFHLFRPEKITDASGRETVFEWDRVSWLTGWYGGGPVPDDMKPWVKTPETITQTVDGENRRLTLVGYDEATDPTGWGTLQIYNEADMVASVILSVKDTASSWDAVETASSQHKRRVLFTYQNFFLLAIEIQEPLVADPVGIDTLEEEQAGAQWQTVETYAFRYQHNTGKLEMVFEPAFYAKFASSDDYNGEGEPWRRLCGLDAGVTDTVAAKYANYHYIYEDGGLNSDEVVSVTTRSGCMSCGGDNPSTGVTQEFSATTNTPAESDPYNEWSTRRELLFRNDTSTKVFKRIIQYNNFFEQPIFYMVEEGDDLDNANPTLSAPDTRTADFYVYDSDGRITTHAENSSLDWKEIDEYNSGAGLPSLAAAFDDVLNYSGGTSDYLRDSVGIINHKVYAGSTTLMRVWNSGESVWDDTPGDVDGYLQDVKIQIGDEGDFTFVKSYKYVSNGEDDTAPTRVFVVAEERRYLEEDTNTGDDISAPYEKTTYAYEWHNSAGANPDDDEWLSRYSSKTTTRYICYATYDSVAETEDFYYADGSEADDGSETLSNVRIYDTLGRNIWSKDQMGLINYYQYADGHLEMQIIDFDTLASRGGDYTGGTAPWSTDATYGGLDKITNYTYDELGRVTQVLGPWHEADIDAVDSLPKRIRTASWTVYQAGSSTGLDQRSTARGHFTGSTYAIDTPITIKLLCKLDRAMETMTIDSDSSRSTAFEDLGTEGKLDKADTIDVREDNGDPKNNTDKFSWSRVSFDGEGELEWRQVYHTIPANDGNPNTVDYGAEGTNFSETNFTYDNYGRRDKTEASGRKGRTFRNEVGVILPDVRDANNDTYFTDLILTGCTETRTYPHSYDTNNDNTPDTLAGPIAISLTNEDGQLVCSMTATNRGTLAVSGGWPTGGEVLNVNTTTGLEYLSLTYYLYDDLGRRIETRTYTDLTGVFSGTGTDPLTIDPEAGSAGYIATKVVHDLRRRTLRRTNAVGAVTATVYDGLGRAFSQWIGTDDTDSTRTDPGDDDDMTQVSGIYYDLTRDGSGTLVPYVTRVRSLTPDATDIFSAGINTDYYRGVETKTVEVATGADEDFQYSTSSSMRLGEVWRESASDGIINSWSAVFELNGGAKDDTKLLAKSDAVYDGVGRALASQTYKVSGGIIVVDTSPVATTYAYDDAGRRITVTGPDGLDRTTAYLDNGQVETVSLVDSGTTVDFMKYVYEKHTSGVGTGRVIEVMRGIDSDAANHRTVQKLQYDSDDDVTDADDEEFRLTGQYSLEAGLTTLTGDGGATGPGDLVFTEFEHDSAGRRTTVILPSFKEYFDNYDVIHKTITAFDNAGRVTAVETQAKVDTAAYLCIAKSTTTYGQNSYSEALVTTRTVYEIELNGTDGDTMSTTYDYDGLGRVCKVTSPAGGFVKTARDLLGNTLATYRCSRERGLDAVNNDDNNDVTLVEGDVVVEQTNYEYDDFGRVILTTLLQRADGDEEDDGETDPATGETLGELTANHYDGGNVDGNAGRWYYSAYWYDLQSRVTGAANYGFDTSYTFARDSSVPTRSLNNNIVTEYAYDYDADGRWYTIVTDNADVDTKTYSDDAGRTTFVVENYVDFVFDAGDPDETGGGTYADDDRVTAYEYNIFGQQTKVIALDINGDGTNDDTQETRYVYALELGDSYKGCIIPSNKLLRGVIYPTSSDDIVGGNISGTDHVEFIYYADRKLRTRTDQRGVQLTSTYNDLGMSTLQATQEVPPSTVDSAVEAIKRTYDSRGRLSHVTSYPNHDATGSVTSDIKYDYDTWNRVSDEWQEHGNVVTGGSHKIGYAYDDADAGLRLTTVTYPNTRTVNYEYSTPDGIADRLSRIDSIHDDVDGNGVDAAHTGYRYLGASKIAGVEHLLVDSSTGMQLTYGTSVDGMPYQWLDRFGRVLAHPWLDMISSTAYDYYLYKYNAAGLAKGRGTVPTSTSEVYEYDDLRRLMRTSRGATINFAFDAVATVPSGVENFVLDAVGNWTTYQTDDTDGQTWVLDQDRDHNDDNEITDITETGDEWIHPAYDDAGNVTEMPEPMAPTTGHDVQYDAWNRLRYVYDEINDDGIYDSGTETLIAEFRYDGAGRRIAAIDGDDERHYYYNAAWQVVQVDKWTAGPTKTLYAQYVWDLRYIDAPIFRDRDTDGQTNANDYGLANGGLNERLYYTNDANQNVTALVQETDGSVLERYRYDTYGNVIVMDGSYTDRGTNASIYDNRNLFAGYILDPESDLYIVRNRVYHPALGRWMQRDPLGLIAGMNLYEYVGGQPTAYIDSLGLYPEFQETGGTYVCSLCMREVQWVACHGGRHVHGPRVAPPAPEIMSLTRRVRTSEKRASADRTETDWAYEEGGYYAVAEWQGEGGASLKDSPEQLRYRGEKCWLPILYNAEVTIKTVGTITGLKEYETETVTITGGPTAVANAISSAGRALTLADVSTILLPPVNAVADTALDVAEIAHLAWDLSVPESERHLLNLEYHGDEMTEYDASGAKVTYDRTLFNWRPLFEKKSDKQFTDLELMTWTQANDYAQDKNEVERASLEAMIEDNWEMNVVGAN